MNKPWRRDTPIFPVPDDPDLIYALSVAMEDQYQYTPADYYFHKRDPERVYFVSEFTRLDSTMLNRDWRGPLNDTLHTEYQDKMGPLLRIQAAADIAEVIEVQQEEQVK